MKRAQSLKDKKEMSEKEIQSNTLRIAINYIQTFSLLLQLKFEWPNPVPLITLRQTPLTFTNRWKISLESQPISLLLARLAFPSIASSLSVINYSLSHLLTFSIVRETNEDLYWINVVITLIKPFCMWLLLCFLEFLWKLCRHNLQEAFKRVKNHSIILLLIPSFMYQTSIIQATFELFRYLLKRRAIVINPLDVRTFLQQNALYILW